MWSSTHVLDVNIKCLYVSSCIGSCYSSTAGNTDFSAEQEEEEERALARVRERTSRSWFLDCGSFLSQGNLKLNWWRQFFGTATSNSSGLENLATPSLQSLIGPFGWKWLPHVIRSSTQGHQDSQKNILHLSFFLLSVFLILFFFCRRGRFVSNSLKYSLPRPSLFSTL